MNKNDAVAVIRSLLTSSKVPYRIYNLNRDFKDETGIDVPLFGYATLVDFLLSLSDTVKLTGTYPNVQISIVANEKSSHLISLVSRQKEKSGKRKGANLRVAKKEKFLDRDEDSLQIFYESEKFVKKKSSSDSVNYQHPNICTDLIYPEYVSRCEKISVIDLKSHTRKGKYIEVYPCEIYNPYLFYIQFRKFKAKLKKLTDSLQKFYIAEEHFVIPDVTIKPGLICAALYNLNGQVMKWHRAEVVRTVTSARVLVNFIDYGITATVPNGNIKFLHNDFRILSRQAVLCALASVIPAHGKSKWSSLATERFRQLAFDKDLIAGVVDSDSEELGVPWISVALSLTKGMEIHINDTLVEEGFAEFKVHTFEDYTTIVKRELKLKNMNENHD